MDFKCIKGRELIRADTYFAGIGMNKTVGEVRSGAKLATAGNGVRIVMPPGVCGDGAVLLVSDDPVLGGMRKKYHQRALLKLIHTVKSPF